MSKLEKGNVADILPLSSVQEGILFHYLYSENSGEYFQQTELNMSGNLDVALMTQALESLVEEHEGLRMVFRWENLKKPLQVILKNYQPDIRFIQGNDDISYIRSVDVEEGIDIEKSPYRILFISHSKKLHTFIFSFHHILFDGWSFGVFLKGLLQKYHLLLEGKQLSSNFVTTGVIKNYLEIIKKHEVQNAYFWKKQLTTFSPNLSLPYMEVTSKVGTGKYTKAITETLMDKIRFCAQKHKISSASIFYAAWAILLYKSSGNSSITFGTTTSGRTDEIPNIDKAIGLFINTLPFHIAVESNQTIINFLKSIHTHNLNIREHEFTSLQEIKKDLDIDINTSLFNTLCVIENYPLTITPHTEGLTVDSSEVYENNNYDITFTVLPFDLKKALHFSYKREHFSKANIAKIADHLSCVLEAIIEVDTDKKVKDIDLLNVEEKSLMRGFNDSNFTFDNIKTIHEELEHRAKTQPESTALRNESTTLTYKQLHEASSILAQELIEKEIEEGTVVGVFMERSYELLISIFAIFKVGGVYLPIDPDFPEERVNYILEDSTTQYILSESRLIHRFSKSFKGNVLEINARVLLQKSYKAILSFRNIEAPAYIIYTSGSTGKPKGVRVCHSSLMNGLYWAQKTYQINKENVFLLKTPIVFDVSLWELFWWVLGGASLCILPPKEEKEIDTLVTYIERYKITNLFMVPTLLRTFTEYVSTFDLNKRVNSLKRIIASGEALKPSDINNFNHTFKNNEVTISNLYGPTEASVHVSYYDCSKEVNINEVPIGKPIANTKFYVLNEDMQIQPVGMTGELYIGGANVAEKYLNKNKLTEESFIDNPFGRGKLYKTGDIVKWKNNGDLLFLGRRDTQVKIRGYRIELGEIENCLSQYEKIKEVKVLLSTEANGEFFLEAFCSGDKELEETDLYQFLEKKIPKYIIPSRFYILDEIPLTHNGKIDKVKLQALRLVKEDQLIQTNVTESNYVLQKLLDVCKEVLQSQHINIKDNFFRIGGDSIKAIRVLSLLRKEGYEISMKDIFENPILQELSLVLKNKISEQVYEVFSGEVKGNAIQTQFFLTDSNRCNQYNQAAILELTQEIDVEGIKSIFKALTTKHDIFRTIFNVNEEEVRVIFLENKFNYVFTHHKLKVTENFDKDIKLIINQMHTGLNIKEGPLARFSYIQAKERNILLLVMHHLIIDGVSWRILLEDLQLLFSEYKGQKSLDLPITSQSFGHYLQAFHEQIDLGVFSSELSYWNQKEVIPKKEFNKEKKVFNYKDFKRNTRLLPISIVEHIQYINQRLNTNTNEIFVSALSIAMKQLYNIEQLQLHLEGHGRTELVPKMDVSRIVGWFTSLYPVVLPVSDGKTSIQYLRYVKEYLRKIPNNGEGYGILKYLQKGVLLEEAPEISFNYMGDFSSLTQTDCFKVTTDQLGVWHDPERKVSHILEIFSILENSNELRLTADFIPELFPEKQIEVLLQRVVGIIQEMRHMLNDITYELRTPSDFTFSNLSMSQLDSVFLEEEAIEDIYELSPTQEGILYQFTNHNDVYSYVVNSSIYLEGKLDKEILERAYQFLIERHDSLRTIFSNALEVEETLQFVKKQEKINIPYKEVIKEEIESYQTFIDAIDNEGREEVNSVFSTIPNVRLNLVKLSDDNYRLAFYYHHILLDGWSVAILFNELFKVYQLLLDGKKPEKHMPAVPSYKFYIKWLRKQNEKEASSYWNTYLQGFEKPFHFETLGTTNSEARYEFVETYLKDIDVKVLKTLASKNKGTVYNYLQTVWALLVSKNSGNNDIVFGQVVSGRPDMEYADKMIGLFINTIPKRVQMKMDMTFMDLVNEIVKDEIATVPYHYYPLANILTNTSYRDQLFSYIVTFENQYQLMEQIDGSLSLVGYEGNDPNHYDLNVFFFEEKEKLKIALRYNYYKYSRDYIVQIVNDFEVLLSETIHNINKPIEEVLIDVTGEMDLPLFI